MTKYITNYKIGYGGQDVAEVVDFLRQYTEPGSFNFTSLLGTFTFEAEDLYEAAMNIRDWTDEINANLGYDTIEIYKPVERDSL